MASGTPESIANMMERYLAGDDRALRRLHRRLKPVLRRAIEQRLFDRARVEDVLQSTFIKAHLSRDRFHWEGRHSDEAVVRWYGAIARHSALDEIRSTQRRRRRIQEVVRRSWIEDEGYALRGASRHFEDDVVAREAQARTIRRVRAAVAVLPPSQRQVVELHRLEGLSADEVGRRLQLQPVTIRVRAHRAQKRLANALQAAA
jgi:RNA polymerase sigma-70 factor (ECF subfamily)